MEMKLRKPLDKFHNKGTFSPTKLSQPAPLRASYILEKIQTNDSKKAENKQDGILDTVRVLDCHDLIFQLQGLEYQDVYLFTVLRLLPVGVFRS